MLYIGRKQGESVVIADRVKVTVLEISGKTAKLGFEFPQDMQVHREEVYQRIQEENREASHSFQLLAEIETKEVL